MRGLTQYKYLMRAILSCVLLQHVSNDLLSKLDKPKETTFCQLQTVKLHSLFSELACAQPSAAAGDIGNCARLIHRTMSADWLLESQACCVQVHVIGRAS